MTAATRKGRRTTYAALLRGINLGARNKISMADLRALFAELGGEDVHTYVQSGNVVFASSGPRDELARTIEHAIRKELGVETAVLLRTKAELAKLVVRNPFAAEEDDPLKLHVTFLAETPPRARLQGIDADGFAPDRLHVAGREAYLHCPNGYGRSKLSNAFLERQLAVAATTRNWRTVTKLAELAAA